MQFYLKYTACRLTGSISSDRSEGYFSIQKNAKKMKKISEDLNPKCEGISQKTYDYLFKVSGQADCLGWDMHILADSLDKDHATGLEGFVWLHNMAARVEALSSEIVEVINRLEDDNKMPL